MKQKREANNGPTLLDQHFNSPINAISEFWSPKQLDVMDFQPSRSVLWLKSFLFSMSHEIRSWLVAIVIVRSCPTYSGVQRIQDIWNQANVMNEILIDIKRL